MAKAHITTKDGTTILIEGTAEEVAVLMARYDGQAVGQAAPEFQVVPKDRAKFNSPRKSSGKAKRTGKRAGPASLVSEMIDNGTFGKPKTLSEIQKNLVQGGHYFPDASIAVALLRAVKARTLRRLRQGDNWAYVV